MTSEKDSTTSILAAIQLDRGNKVEHYWIEMELEELDREILVNAIGTLYTSTGRSFRFESTKAGLISTLHGPIREKRMQRTPVRQFEMEVNKEYLSLGLNRLNEFFEAAERYRNHVPDAGKMSYTIRSSPIEDPMQRFPAEVVEFAQLSEASERAFVGALPALTEFFKVVYETDGLKDLLLKLIPKKELLPLLNPFSKSGIQFSYGEPRPEQISAVELKIGMEKVGSIPVVLSAGTKPLLKLRLYTTDPSYEWKVCAGIVALEVQSTTHPENRCLIRAFPHKMITARNSDAIQN